jgi:excinuclease ABC subunit B
MNYARNDVDFSRGTFRARGSVVEVYPKAADRTAYRLDFFGDELEKIEEVDVLTGEVLNVFAEVVIYPATMYQAQTEFF